MSIFGSIVSAIFGHKSAAAPAPGGAPAPSVSPGSAPAPSGSSTASDTAPGSVAPKPMTREQVEEMIEKIADDQDQDYNWDTSIVDLMKLLKLDSSLNARKDLAKELGYTGELNGSAEMNVWLHKQVMDKLAASGGGVPDSLRVAKK